MNKDKKGVSPVVSTVLLIMIVIILAIIILLWTKGFIKEVLTKEIAGVSKPIDDYCNEVTIQPILNEDGTFGFNNEGPVPIQEFKVKLSYKDTGKSETKSFQTPVSPGFPISLDSLGNSNQYEKVEIIPVLIGTTEKGDKQLYECPVKYAKQII